MADVAVSTLGDIAAHLAWPHYQQLLGHFLKGMQRQGDTNKVGHIHLTGIVLPCWAAWHGWSTPSSGVSSALQLCWM